MSLLPLFDLPAAAAPTATVANTRVPASSDIRRRIEHRYGTFIHLRCMTEAERQDSKTHHSSIVTREYQLVELYDGQVFEESVRTVERRSSKAGALIEANLRSGLWREVSA